jgi:hypothetical protein
MWGLRMPFRILLLCDLGAFARDILFRPHGFNVQKHIRISRKGAEPQRRKLTEGVASAPLDEVILIPPDQDVRD